MDKSYINSIIVDTVAIKNGYFDVDSNHGLKVMIYSMNSEEGSPCLTYKDTGETIYNKKLYLNEDHIRITVIPGLFGRKPLLIVQFEMPKLIYGNNINPTNYQQNGEILKKIFEKYPILGMRDFL